jgi:hypothetical protein
MGDSQKVNELKVKLQLLMKNPQVGPKRRPGCALELLNKLRKLPITLDLMIKTKIGFTVNEIRKSHISEEVSKLTQTICDEWKVLLPVGKNNWKKKSIPIKAPPVKIKKLPPIGYSPECRSRTSKTSTPIPRESSISDRLLKESSKDDNKLIGGNQLYSETIKKQKRERSPTSHFVRSPPKKPKPFNIWNCGKKFTLQKNPFVKPENRVENWPVPTTITPIDRLKIIGSRNLDGSDQSTSENSVPLPYHDEYELELNISRARSSKSFGINLPRKEHKPKA